MQVNRTISHGGIGEGMQALSSQARKGESDSGHGIATSSLPKQQDYWVLI